ncbi:MAG: PAS domain S-box protein, partial [Proteobacteria bacterium]|nr:PAS domain S-box protein [Pseudomonadota bacterium]
VLVLDPEGRVVRFNRACEEATGYAAAEVEGRFAWDLLIPPEQREATRAFFSELKAGAFPSDRDNEWLTKGGSRRLISWSNTALTRADGSVQWVIATGIDVTEHRRADAALRRSEERYRALVENVDLGITLIAADHTVLMANAAQGRFFGRDPQSFLGRKCYEEFEKRDERCAHCPGTRTLATGLPAEAETEGLRDDGTRLVARIRAFPVLGPGGAPEAFIEVVEDVTEARRAGEERQRLEAQMQQAQKLESLGVLAGGIAHDFNNLLMGVLGNADMALAKTPPESPLRAYLQRIETAARRAADLTNQMLAYSGKGRFVVEPINLSRLVEEMGHLLATVVSKRALLRYDLGLNLPAVEADATQLRQVVMNLIVNASDAIGERSGVITVHSGTVEADRAYLRSAFLSEELPEGTYACLEVSDTGCGMDAETRARIFDPFFTTKTAGRGLGLAAVLGIVRGHRGALKVYSEVGRGTTFKVLLPVSSAAGPQGSGGGAADGTAADAIEWRARGTVLVVDDDETVRAVARMMLEDAGLAVVTATDGRDAVELYRRDPDAVDLVLLDMNMPHMGGEETFRELRRVRPDVRVILSSGYNEQDAVVRFSGRGLSGFLQKPYRVSALLAKVREVLEGTAPGT